jgi:hypothetical protein
VKMDTGLLQDLHAHMAALTKASGLDIEKPVPGEQPTT